MHHSYANQNSMFKINPRTEEHVFFFFFKESIDTGMRLVSRYKFVTFFAPCLCQPPFWFDPYSLRMRSLTDVIVEWSYAALISYEYGSMCQYQVTNVGSRTDDY